MTVRDVRGPATPPVDVAFLDGIQRYAVEGRIGLVPVVRGYVAAAVLRRSLGELRPVILSTEEFLVVPEGRLEASELEALRAVGLPLHDCSESDRAHPILDVQLAAKVVEARREYVETELAKRFLREHRQNWLVVDGAITGLTEVLSAETKVLGFIKSHETQFLDGADLNAALTLPEGHRTSVFARRAGREASVYSWYLRLWPWEDQDLLHGLVRIERPPEPAVLREADEISRWLLAERSPLAAGDVRWDRLLYPVQQVEAYLRAQAGGWW